MLYRSNEPLFEGKEKEYVLDVIESGWLSIGGYHTKIFEEEFAKLVGVKHALAVQSGTAALHTSLLALGVGKGDKVVVPNFTCGSCITPVLQCGATPIILDVEQESFGLDINRLKQLIEKEKLKAVMPVHMYGFTPRDFQAIVSLCKNNGIFVLEDACEALGAEIKGQKLGSLGDIAAFSVRSEKMIGVGEGGMVLTNDKALYDKAFYWASRAAPYRREKDPLWDKYLYTGIGMNYLMPHLPGAVGRAQLENFESILAKKREVAKTYRGLLKDVKGIKLQQRISDSNPAYWLNAVILEDKTKEEVREIGEELHKRGVEIRPAFFPLGNQEIFKEYAWGDQNVGNYLFEKSFVLPSSVFLAKDDCKGVKEIVNILLEVKDSAY